MFSWCRLWICYGVRCVHIFVPLGKRSTLFFLRAQMYTFSSTVNKKIQTFVWHHITKPRLLLNSNINKEFGCIMVFTIKASNTLKFQFVFFFNECLWAIYSLLSFENFWFYIWVVVVWLLILRQNWLQVTSYLILMNKKSECKDHQIHSKMLKKICKKEI